MKKNEQTENKNLPMEARSDIKITVDPIDKMACTRCEAEKLSSYRREGQGGGRNIAFIWRDPEAPALSHLYFPGTARMASRDM